MSIDETLRAHYGAAARKATTGAPVVENCGTPTIGARLYRPDELALLPDEAVAASIGCANPVALADLQPGDDVLDLGSGGGIDVLLSARRVAPSGRAYGLDMTPEMLSLARANQTAAGVTNAEFLDGHIEDIPLPDAGVDVVISNCVINLSTDKTAVLAEAHRVLRPGGRFAVADVVADHAAEPGLDPDDAAWAACTAGALTRSDYRARLDAAGFTDIEITDSHQIADGYWSVLVRATKPAAAQP